MIKKISIKLLVVLVLFSFLTQSRFVFAEANISDIETAILKEDYKSAQDLALEILSHKPDEGIAHKANYFLAISYIKSNKYQEAQDIFKTLVNEKLEGNLKDKAYLGLFDSYFLNEQYQQAHDTIEKLLKLSPKSEYVSLIYLKAAKANLKLAHWEQANEQLKKITANYPDSFEVHPAKQLLNEKQYFAVQVGSFKESKSAEHLMAELKAKNEYAYIVETIDSQDKKFYRVRVGQLAALDDARKLKSELSTKGYPSTQIFP